MIQISNREFLRYSHSQSTISEERFLRFLKELKLYLKNIQNIENEEAGKIGLRRLLISLGFHNYKIEPFKEVDLVIFEENREKEVFIETKLPNSPEMILDNNFQKKSFAQICYYFEKYGTSALKHLIITDYKTLYLFKSYDILQITQQFPKHHKKAKTSEIYETILENVDFSKIKYTKIDFLELEISTILYLYHI